MLGHVRRRHAVAQLHLAPRAADLRALERGDERPGLVAQAPDLRAHRLEHLPHLPMRRPPVVLQARDLVADALEVLRDRIQGALDLLGALPELARRRRAIRRALRRRQLLDLLGHLPQRVGGDRLHLLGELLAVARHERDLLLGRGAQLGELPFVRGLALAGEARGVFRIPARLEGGLQSGSWRSRARFSSSLAARSASVEARAASLARRSRGTSSVAEARRRPVPTEAPALMTAHLAPHILACGTRRYRYLRTDGVAYGLPCSQLSLRGQATSPASIDWTGGSRAAHL